MAVHLGTSRYDPDLQMFTDPPREPDWERLRFLRWLAERARLEHDVAGTPTGETVAEAPAEVAGAP